MSWAGTYAHNVLIGLDCLGAAVLFNRNDLTISSLCRLVQLADQGSSPAFRVLLEFDLHWWQRLALRRLAVILDWIQIGHCALAICGDMQRADSIRGLISAIDQVKK